MAQLRLEGINVRFGGLQALADIEFAVSAGEIVGLIGPNGAGKTTIFNVITGVYRATSGDVRLDDTSLRGKRPYQILTLGIARTFQNIRLFTNMTAVENAMVSLH
ncbi:MAG: ATP-binding cassette domain-containing protein, partial [Desulfobacterales bacterium]